MERVVLPVARDSLSRLSMQRMRTAMQRESTFVPFNLDDELRSALDSLGEHWADDDWFKRPEGYMKKSDFGSGGISKAKGKRLLEMVGRSRFRKRWFALVGKQLNYYRARGDAIAGSLDLSTIKGARVHDPADGEEHSFDLLGKEGDVYTLVAEDRNLMGRWIRAVMDAVQGTAHDTTGAVLSGETVAFPIHVDVQSSSVDDAVAPLQVLHVERSLARNILMLERTLEGSPDPWFSEPQGYLEKPDFKQLHVYPSDSVAHSFHRRWFVLDGERLRYFRNFDVVEESGSIDLSKVIAIRCTTLESAPMHAVDLLTAARRYIVSAASNEEMLRWALVLRNAITNVYRVERDGGEHVGRRWKHLDITFQVRKPLRISLRPVANLAEDGTKVNDWLCISDFLRGEGGEIGPAEGSGELCRRDIIVGVNKRDLTNLSFGDAMGELKKASYPMTLHVVRDRCLMSSQAPVLVEGWGWVRVQGSGGDQGASHESFRRRYMEMHEQLLAFFAPTPGGRVRPRAATWIKLDRLQAVQRRHIAGERAERSWQLMLRFAPWRNVSRADSLKAAQGSGDAAMEIRQTVPQSAAETISISFESRGKMETWCAGILEKCHDHGVASTEIEEVEHVPVERPALARQSLYQSGAWESEIQQSSSVDREGELLLLNQVRGDWEMRYFTICNGSLLWCLSKSASKHMERNRRILGCTTGAFNMFELGKRLEKVMPIQVESTPDRGAGSSRDGGLPEHFELFLATSERTLTLGMPDEETCRQWLQSIAETIPPAARSTVVKDTSTMTDEQAMEVTGRVPRPADSEDIVDGGTVRQLFQEAPESTPLPVLHAEGWMYKKGDSRSGIFGIGSDHYRRRYFVLLDDTLAYFTTNLQAIESISSAYCLAEEIDADEPDPSDAELPTAGLEGVRSAAVGSIDVCVVLECRMSQDSNGSVPEHAIDIVTPGRTYLVIPDGAVEASTWIQAISARVAACEEMDGGRDRHQSSIIARRASVSGAELEAMASEHQRRRRLSLKRKVLCSGRLLKKTYSRLTRLTTWKLRFFVLTSHQISYYERESDLYDENADPLNALSIHAVVGVATSEEKSGLRDVGGWYPTFSLTVKSAGSKHEDQRTFVLEAENSREALRWMESIADATRRLRLESVDMPSGGSGFTSVEDTEPAPTTRRSISPLPMLALPTFSGADMKRAGSVRLKKGAGK